MNDAVTMPGGEGTLLVGRYRVVRQLGQGGMGSVWLAEDTQLDNKPFAIKMLPSILVSNKRAYRQLKDEALVAMKLVHPNIVQIRAFEENNGNPFLVMDHIDGQTLDDYLADYDSRVEHVERVEGGGGLPEAEVIRILGPIAAALDYAHSKGVVHRDVKPGNVMVVKDGTPYILDFGIAREMQETLTRVTGKLSSGTLLYMSPEQLNGDPPKPAQDVYSFAVMVYECVKGAPPFVRGAIEDQIRNKVPEPLPEDVLFGASVMAALAKKPEDRPPTCAAVLEGGGFTQSRGAAEDGDLSFDNARPGHPSIGVGKVLAGLVLLAALVGGYYGWKKYDRGVREHIARESRVAEESLAKLKAEKAVAEESLAKLKAEKNEMAEARRANEKAIAKLVADAAEAEKRRLEEVRRVEAEKLRIEEAYERQRQEKELAEHNAKENAERVKKEIVEAKQKPDAAATKSKEIAHSEARGKEVGTIEALRHEAMNVQAMREIEAARAAVTSGEFDESVRHYGIAWKLLDDSPKSRDLKRECTEGIAEGLYREGLEEYRSGRRNRAIKYMEKAVELHHPKARDQLEKWLYGE